MSAQAGIGERVTAAQDRALAGYLRAHVQRYSPLHGAELVRAGGDLRRIPVRRLAAVADPADLVLRPTAERLAASGDPATVARLWWARLTRREATLNRTVVEPVYKPVLWHLAAGQPLGSSAEDVERLAEIGRATLEVSGVGPYDRLVAVLPGTGRLSWWQLSLGARRGGVPAVFLDGTAPPARVAALDPTVLAGPPAALRMLLGDAGRSLPSLRVVVVVDDPVGPELAAELAAAMEAAGLEAAVRGIWAPPGTRALWARCIGGAGWHTWPATERVEAADGRLVWTPIAWKGSVLLRGDLGLPGAVHSGPCPGCGRTAPRVTVGAGVPAAAFALDREASVSDWQLELAGGGSGERPVVHVAVDADPVDPVLRRLDEEVAALQYVVADRREVAGRIAAAGGRRIVERRA